MAESWANYGIDLHLDLAGTRVRAGLEAGLRDAVRSGRLAPGTRLPSSRDLAADLRIARNTVADAYGQLVAEGWLTATTGSGTWVAERRVATPGPRSTKDTAPGQPRFDLRAGAPASTAFDRRHWLTAARAALNAAPDDVLGYPDPRGLAELRTALAGYLARARGVITSPENIVICAGFAHGLALICRVLAERGAKAVAIEAYGHQAHRSLIAAQRLAPVPLPVDASGATPAEAVLAQAGAVVLTPAHQFPLGMTLAPRRRTAFVDWAARNGGLIIEDDYDGEFRYDRQPVGALQALAPEHVVYAGTASKSLAPGLRLGWLVVPPRLLPAILAARRAAGGPGALDQLVLAELIRSGAYDRQVRRARLVHRRRRDRLVAALRREVPEARVTGIAAGLHAVVELPPGLGEREVVARARGRGLLLEGLGAYRAGSSRRPPSLVVGYATPPEHAFSAAVARLCAALG